MSDRMTGERLVEELQLEVQHQMCVTAELQHRIDELEAKTLHITISKTEMDFGGEGVIMHPNHIAQMEELSRQQDQRIEKLQRKYEALTVYAAHLEDCDALMPTLNPAIIRRPCSCGLRALLENDQ